MELTNTTIIVITAIAALLIGSWLGVRLSRHTRTKKLQRAFGPEYEQILNELGDRSQAENVLALRLKHVNALDIRPLSLEEVEDFTAQWQENQVDFVDEPFEAVQNADRLIREVMETKGYPVEDFEQQAADISVDYPELVNDFRGLHSIVIKGQSENISTEDMRLAMLHGRELFNNLMKKVDVVEALREKETSQ